MDKMYPPPVIGQPIVGLPQNRDRRIPPQFRPNGDRLALNDTAKRFQESATAHNLLLNLDLSLPELYVFVDKEAITKIFSNLFTNAIKYASGSIIIRLQLSPDYETFTIDFINDGTPIPAELKEKNIRTFLPGERRRYG